MTYGIEVSKADGTKNVADALLGGRLFVQFISQASGTSGTYTFDYISSDTHLKIYTIRAGYHTLTTSVVNSKATLTITAVGTPTSAITTRIAVFTTNTVEPTYGIAVTKEIVAGIEYQRLVSSVYAIPEFIGKVVPSSTPTSTTDVGSLVRYTHTTSVTVGDGRNRLVLWTIPESTNTYISTGIGSYTNTSNNFLNTAANQEITVNIYAPTGTAYNMPEAYIFALDNYSPSNDTYGLRLYNSDSPAKLIFDAGLEHMKIKAFDTINYTSTESSITSLNCTGTLPALLLPSYTRIVKASNAISTYSGVVRRVGSTLYSKYILTDYEGGASGGTSSTIYGANENLLFGVDAIALGASATQALTGSIINTTVANSGTATCSYNTASLSSCNTTEYFTASYSGGNTNAVTYAWSLTSATGFSISGSTTGASVVVINNSAGSATAYSGTLQCVFTQTDSATVTKTYALSHLHTANTNSLTGTIASTVETLTCNYNSPGASTCSTAQTLTITPTAGTGTGGAITYAWSVDAGPFTINNATGTVTTVTLNSAGLYTGSTYTTYAHCTMFQNSVPTVINYFISHIHTKIVPALAVTINSSTAQTCNYTSLQSNCTTSETFTATPVVNTGNGNTINYAWSSSNPSFGLSSASGTSTIISLTGTGLTTGTEYTSVLTCYITQTDSTPITITRNISHTHTGYSRIDATISAVTATSCIYTAPDTTCSTSDSFTVTPTAGTGNNTAITYTWSKSGGDVGSFTISSSGNTATISVNATGRATAYTTTLICTVSQAGSLARDVSQVISHLHTGYSALNLQSIDKVVTGNSTCSYTGSSTCTTYEEWSATVLGGNNTYISYLWTTSNTNFIIDNPTSTSTGVRLVASGIPTGQSYTTTLTLTISQSGTAGTKSLSTTLTRIHTGYSAFSASFTPSDTTSSCSYNQASYINCETHATRTVTTSGGDPNLAVSYTWSHFNDTPSAFTLTNPTSASAVLSITSSGATTGTIYETDLRCVVVKGVAPATTYTVTVDEHISHTHTSTLNSLTGSLSQSGTPVTTCNYTRPSSPCTTTETYIATPTAGTGNGTTITYSWSINNANFSVSSSGNTATVTSSTAGVTTGTILNAVLTCTMTQSSVGSPITQNIQHTHTGYDALLATVAASGVTTTCAYTVNTGYASNCSTSETYTITPTVGTGNGGTITYAWSLIGLAGTDVNVFTPLTSTTSTSVTVALTVAGRVAAYTATLRCTVTQNGISFNKDQTISRTHTEYSELGVSLSSTTAQVCKYTLPAAVCYSSQTCTATPSGGNGGTITYIWTKDSGSVDNFILTSTNGVATIALTDASENGTWSIVLKCAITQSGTVGSKVATTTVTHTRNQYPALVLGVISGTTGTTASYIDPPNVAATSSETFSVSPTGGDGTTITYDWGISGGDISAGWAGSVSTNTAILTLTAPGLGTGTAYSTTLGCTISQVGAGTISPAYKTIARTHTGSYALASLGCNGSTLTVSRVGPNTALGSAKGWFYIKSDGTWALTTTFTSSGTGAVNSSSGTATGNWHSQPGTNIGAAFYVRFTASVTGYSGGTSSPTSGNTTGWLALSNMNLFCSNYLPVSNTVTTLNSLGTYTIDIATDSAGSNIKSTTTVYLSISTTNTGSNL